MTVLPSDVAIYCNITEVLIDRCKVMKIIYENAHVQ